MHAGFEFLYLLEGELEIHHGDQHCTLRPRDAIYFDAGTPHSYCSVGKKPAEAIIVTMHQPPSAQSVPPQPVSALRTAPGKSTLPPTGRNDHT
jgi:mannose-6-phosphate isomerase-like protein (cupin superfamily)